MSDPEKLERIRKLAKEGSKVPLNQKKIKHD